MRTARLAARLAREVYVSPPTVFDRGTDAQAQILTGASVAPYDVAVVFRGTDSARDWLSNLDVLSSSLSFVTADCAEHRVHRGFCHQYNSIREDLLRAVVPSPAAAPREALRVLVTGHSLGGALAHLAALDVRRALPDVDVSVVTFGSPRVMCPGADGLFANPMRCVRFTHGVDPVPMVPLPLRFRHVGQHVGLASRRAPWWASLTNPVADHDMSFYEEALGGLDASSSPQQ